MLADIFQHVRTTSRHADIGLNFKLRHEQRLCFKCQKLLLVKKDVYFVWHKVAIFKFVQFCMLHRFETTDFLLAIRDTFSQTYKFYFYFSYER